jgi:hypothetical protein
MKTWFAKFRISSALDGETPLPPGWQESTARNAEVRRFAETSQALHRALKSGPKAPELPAFLHESIMRAVTGAAGPRIPPSPWLALRWLPVPALAVLLAAGFWWSLRRAPAPQPLAPASAVLEAGQDMTRTVPAAVMAPLSDEWQRVNRDVRHTTQFLWASLP